MLNIPYFYILQHKVTLKYYAGCRYSKMCHPSDLLKTYFTSSTLIREIIQKEGIDIFSIITIITDFGGFNKICF